MMYQKEKVILESPQYTFGTDEFGRWLFVKDLQLDKEVIIFVPMTGDHVVTKVVLLEDGSGFMVSGWRGEAEYTFDACFSEPGTFKDIRPV